MAAARTWKPPEFEYPDEWAEARRRLPPGSPIGDYSLDKTPYLRRPMRDFVNPDVSVIVLMVASQMGKTECGFSVLGWMWESRPAPAIWVCPTMRLAMSLSRDRLNAMFRSTEGLWDRLDATYRKPGSLERFVSGQRFGIAWAGSTTELASHPCQWVIVDERSRMGDDTGSEGDPVRLAMARTKMYEATRKIGVFSSPGEEELCPTYRWWVTGTRNRWCWRCPGCGEWYVPCLEHAHYPEGASYAAIRQEAWMQCPTCEHRVHDAERLDVEADYVPCDIDAETKEVTLAPERDEENSVASYWATGFASPTTGIGRVMEEYARAARDGEHTDVKAVVNTYAGELYRVPGEATSADAVKDCQVAEIPDEDAALVTMGADVQAEGIWYVVRMWCPGVSSYLLGHGYLHGSTEYPDVYADLEDVASATYCGLGVRLGLIDSGYRTAEVYDFQRNNARWRASKGVDQQEKPYRISKVEVTAAGRVRSSVPLVVFSADYWKLWLYQRITRDKTRPGGWYVPAGIDDDYCKQVTNERFRIRRGKREWYRTGSQHNHLLDCEVLAAIAADLCNIKAARRPAPKRGEPESVETRRPARPMPDPSLERREL